MKLILVGLVVCLSVVYANHLIVGNVANRVVLANQARVEYNAIPFIKRVKYFFYTQPDNRLIQGIQALDTMHSKASINITAGGVGYSYVNLRLKSERGRGLAYDIGIYVQDLFYH
ncbi:uncharacterized protein LOC111350036 [Spodoptera litura]|uniref:Uncharacterized protein LOC111350036 n=1 Tax=Spodoptera litura TaxID=69820 RepID=A0A9J7DSB9_SPOLT|nr:uncharacterized protein LOC111350036 [Spodoptera litura]